MENALKWKYCLYSVLHTPGGGDDDMESSSSLFEVESDRLSEDESLHDEFEISGRFYYCLFGEQTLRSRLLEPSGFL